MSDYMDGKKTN